MKTKPVIVKATRLIQQRGNVVDWPDIRDLVNTLSGSDWPPSVLDRATQSVVNKLHKSAPYLLARA